MSLVMSGTSARKKAAPRKSRKKRSTFDTTLGRAVLQLLAVAVFFALWELGVAVSYTHLTLPTILRV